MWGDWLSADDIVAMLDDMALDTKEPAFAHNGHIHLYSGPSRFILDLISGANWDNHVLAVRRAAHMGAVLIDDTRAGKFLTDFKGIGNATVSEKGTFGYFRANPHIDDIDRLEQGRLPWRHASRLFALSAWGHVTTTINGAFRGGVYYTIEIPHALNDEHPTPADLPFRDAVRELFVPRKKPIEFINMVPFERVAKGYKPTGWEQAGRLICLGEQRMALHDALQGTKPATIRKALTSTPANVLAHPLEAFEYFLESREAYRVDRARMMKETTGHIHRSAFEMPSARQVTRERTLKEFASMAMSLVKAELDLMSPEDRPNIPAFSLISGRAEVKVS